MPVTVVVGGQYGSEGKGKVACHLARTQNARFAVRVGGSNSGHTVIDDRGRRFVFRHLPTAAILKDTVCIIAPGSYIDPDVLLAEIDQARLPKDRLLIDPNAVIITNHHRVDEASSGLTKTIGSTGSGTGSALIDRVKRDGKATFVNSDERLANFVHPTSRVLRAALDRHDRVVIEGTQGFGLSVLHSPYYPKVTSRDTTAASCISEAGLSPLDVDDVVLVIRSFPIRVAGDSGPLANETSWDLIQRDAGYECAIVERTTVTNRVRRVGRFDPEIVLAAIGVNQPTQIVINHLDYVDSKCSLVNLITANAEIFLQTVEREIGQQINLVGIGPSVLLDRTSEVSDALAS